MKKTFPLALLALLVFSSAALAKEARLIRYPHYHEGRVAFSYLGDVWTADEDGRNVQRLTVNRARDVYPRFSPDGKWIAFSSDRNGNLDVYLIPSAGGTVKQLTSHSADDTVLGWSPDGRSVLFSSNRGEGFLPVLYTVSVEGGMPVSAARRASLRVWWGRWNTRPTCLTVGASRRWVSVLCVFLRVRLRHRMDRSAVLMFCLRRSGV
jgi:WD40 repeat protein